MTPALKAGVSDYYDFVTAYENLPYGPRRSPVWTASVWRRSGSGSRNGGR